VEQVASTTTEAKGARAFGQSATLRRISPPRDHLGGRGKAPTGTHRESLTDSIRVKLPAGLKRDVKQIVEYLGLWHTEAEFVRDAVRKLRNRWIDEARQTERELEEGDETRGHV